jgi:hypothetical protein
MIAQARAALTTVLENGGLRAMEYVPERITPPMAVIQPSGDWVASGDTFAAFRVGFDVTLIVQTASNQVVASQLDDLVDETLAAITAATGFYASAVSSPTLWSTFLDASLGGAVDLYIEGELIQSTESTSLWSYLYANPGKELNFRYSPWGTGTGATNPNTADKPGYTGTIRLPRIMAPGLGGAASVDGTFASDTIRMDIIGTLTVDTTATTWARA